MPSRSSWRWRRSKASRSSSRQEPRSLPRSQPSELGDRATQAGVLGIGEVELIPRHAIAAAVLPWAEETESRPADQRGREALERRIGADMVLGDREIAAPRLGADLLDAADRFAVRADDPPAEEKLDMDLVRGHVTRPGSCR